MRAALLLVVLGACGGGPVHGDGSVGEAADVCRAPASPSRLVVTADWMARSLTLLDLQRVLDPGCSVEEAIVGTIDLSPYPPGPIQVEIAPDGRTALALVGPGFFEGTGGALVGNPEPELDGAVLIVDLLDRAVLAEIPTRHVPMGAAIAPDGRRAYVAGFGHSEAPGDTLAIVDLEARVLLEEVRVGARPEQVALSEDGSIGAVSLDGPSALRIFRTADVAGSLSPEIDVGRDPSDIAFVPGTTRLVAVGSLGLTWSIVDVADPSAPSVIATSRVPGGAPYGVTWIPGTSDVLVTTSLREQLVRVSALDPAAPAERFVLDGGPFVLGVAVTSDGRHALVPHPISHRLAVVDLQTGARHAIAWLDRPGPTYVQIQP